MANFQLMAVETDPAKGLRWQLGHATDPDESGVHDFQSPQEIIALAVEALEEGTVSVEDAWDAVSGVMFHFDDDQSDLQGLVENALCKTLSDDEAVEEATRLIDGDLPRPWQPHVREAALEVLRDLNGDAGEYLFAYYSASEWGVEVWAAERTPLPEWAEIDMDSVGGIPDSIVPFLKLQPGKTLEDLRAWQREHPVDVTRW